MQIRAKPLGLPRVVYAKEFRHSIPSSNAVRANFSMQSTVDTKARSRYACSAKMTYKHTLRIARSQNP